MNNNSNDIWVLTRFNFYINHRTIEAKNVFFFNFDNLDKIYVEMLKTFFEKVM